MGVVCGEIEFVDNRNDVIVNPVVIIEVLSESTKDYDRGSKFKAYRNTDSLKDYIVIDQYSHNVEHFYKNEAGKWELDEFKSLDDTLKIRFLGVELSLNAIYSRVEL
jgi:Uma2 family endonuclease